MGAIQVRMYNVGFGDCFLVRIPTEDGERRLLIDCGFHTQGRGEFTDEEIARQIAKDLDGKGLHVVVATHRHQDHLSGFSVPAVWEKVTVEEVWLPFTAKAGGKNGDPAFADWDRIIRVLPQLVDQDGRLTRVATNALAAMPNADPESIAFLLWNARENATALETLTKKMCRASGGAARKRYLPEKATPETLKTPVLPAVKVHVLGPPRDPKLRIKMELPSQWGVTAEGDIVAIGGSESPFGAEWRLDESRVAGRKPFLEKSLETIATFNTDLAETAYALDAFLNGESVVLALEFGAATLLFTGDAEVAAWKNIIDTPAAARIAAQATFLKVGHHGSANATPLKFLTDNLSNVPAVISTQEGGGTFRNNIPRKELVDELAGRMARSDRPPKKATGIFRPSPDGKWIDCEIPC